MVLAMSETPHQSRRLTREVGTGGAVLLGLGSIIGTGVFVSLGIAAGVTGSSVVLAVGIAALLATFNGLNSAQLAANHPVSGGTYEYGYHYLNPWLGFTAGWAFIVAKSASAATAALGFAGYVTLLADRDDSWLVPIGLAAVVALTVVVLLGLRRSNTVNTIIVTVTMVALGAFVLVGLPDMDGDRFRPFLTDGAPGLLEASALMFVAFTGYGRIATLGEEVKNPSRTIPRAVIVTLLVSAALYGSVAVVGVGTATAGGLAAAVDDSAAPLEAVAGGFTPDISALVAVGAITAMLGVLLNLILGLSRVVLAMGRRGDLPDATARLNTAGTTPPVAVIVVATVIGALVLIGDVKTTWTFSAFTVLVYYAITNLAALQIPDAARRFPRWVAWAGLGGCLFLAFWVDVAVWAAGLTVLAGGLVWHAIRRSTRSPS
jgi:APA family basic amino acid/polyamine antiporter